MPNQFDRILALMKENGGKVTTGQLAAKFLFHKAASRLGAEARRKGFVITFTKGETWDLGVYTLLKEPQDSPISNKKADLSPEYLFSVESYGTKEFNEKIKDDYQGIEKLVGG